MIPISTFSPDPLDLASRDLMLFSTCTLIHFSQGQGGAADLKLADFGLSALVRLDEDGYDVGESSKRKNYRGLKDVSFSSSVDSFI